VSSAIWSLLWVEVGAAVLRFYGVDEAVSVEKVHGEKCRSLNPYMANPREASFPVSVVTAWF